MNENVVESDSFLCVWEALKLSKDKRDNRHRIVSTNALRGEM